LLELGRAEDAVKCLREAVAAAPANPAFREGLAAAQEAAGDVDAAQTTLLRGIAAAPALVAPRNAAILLSIRHRDFGRAVQLAEEARVAGIADACLLGLKGHALSNLGRHEEAAEAYADALKLGPDDAYVRHLVAASGAVAAAPRAPIEYVRAVFDGYAERFEPHLISLGYRVPGIFRSLLLQHPRIAVGQQVGPVLDLGCGTGMIAVALQDLSVGPFTGVDVSPRMLERAAAKDLYKELRQADLMAVLATDTASWQLVLAGDVFCYLGALEEVFSAIYARLAPGGWLVCSVEELRPDDNGAMPNNGVPGRWALRRQGRYAHTEHYVRDAAVQAGYTIRRLERQVLRQEPEGPVAGILAVLERAPDVD